MKPLNQITSADILNFIKEISPKTWGMIAGGISGAILVVMFILIPAWVTRLQIRAQIKDIQTQMATTQNLLRKQPQLIKNKENFIKVSQDVMKRLYEPGEASLLLGVVSKLAQESKVSVVSSTPKKFEGKFPPPFDVRYEANAYDFTVEGGYHDLATFVSKIENNAKVLRIQTYNVRPQEKTPDKHLAELSLTAVSTKAAGGGK